MSTLDSYMNKFQSHKLKALLLVALAFAAYWGVGRLGFIWDDDLHVTANPLLTSTAGLWDIWFKFRSFPQIYPLTLTSFWLQHGLWGLNPLPYHLVNVAFQALNGYLLWRVLSALGLRLAFVCAVLFTLHPINVESVAWVTELKNLQSGAFYLASALVFFTKVLPAEDSRVEYDLWWWLSLLLFALAFLSKGVTSTLPAAIVLALWFRDGRVAKRTLVALAPFFVLGVCYGLMTAWMERTSVGASGGAWSYGLLERFALSGEVSWFYVWKIIWPAKLAFFYHRWEVLQTPLELLFPVSVAAVAAMLWFARDRLGRGPLTAWLFYLGTIFPVMGYLNVFPMQYSHVADHFQYLAGIGIICLFVYVVEGVAKSFSVWVFAGVAAVYVVLVTLQIPIYKDSETLWLDTIKKTPSCNIAYRNLASLYISQDLSDKSMEVIEKAIGQGLNDANNYIDYGVALYNKGRAQESVRYFEMAMGLDPQNPVAVFNVGLGYTWRNEPERAESYFARALEIKPDYAPAYYQLGVLARARGQGDYSRRLFMKALSLDPGMASARRALE